MPDDDDTVEVERVRFRERTQSIDCAPDVLMCSRPTTARLPEATILDVPRCDALRLQRIAHRRQVSKARVGRLEASAMNQNDDWMRSATRRKSKLAKLVQISSICDVCIGGSRGDGRKVLRSH
jgi:hypothetical protein